MSTTKKKKKKKPKRSKENSPVQYVSLSIHRKWPNPLNYLSYLKVVHSNTQTLIYDIDRILNSKWIDLRRPEIIEEFNELHQQSIDKHFQHQIDLYQSKYRFFQNEFEGNETFSRQVFLRWTEFTDRLENLHQQIQRGQTNIFEYRLTLLKNEFEQEKHILNDFFLHHELKELDDQIHLLDIRKQKEFLQQEIQYQLTERDLKESFMKNLHQLQSSSQQEIDRLQTILSRIIRANDQQLFPISKNCHRLFTRIEQAKHRMNNELITISIVKKKIHETKMKINRNESKSVRLNEKLNLFKQNSIDSSKNFSTFRENRNQIVFRRFCTLVDDVKKICLKKLAKAQRILLLADQCQRLEVEKDQIFLLQLRSNLLSSKISSQRENRSHCSCDFDFHPDFDQLSLLWKRLAHVQMDLHILRQENLSQKQLKKFFQEQLNHFT